MQESKRRTIAQNRALHAMFEQIAVELNDRGLDMKKLLKPHVDIPWTKESVKDYIWRPIQTAMTNKVSSADISTKDIDQIFMVLKRHFIDKFDLDIHFPSVEEIINKQRLKDER